MGIRRRRRNLPPPPRTGPRVNEAIRARRVKLIDEQGNQLGEFQPPDALRLARERGLDLVEVAADARPPVCRIADYGRMKYERKKKAKAGKNNASSSTMKQLKVRPKTDDHDLMVKIRKSRKFLGRGDKVRIVVFFRGREHAHHDIGADQCRRIAEACADVGRIESPPTMDGRRMQMVMAPHKGAPPA